MRSRGLHLIPGIALCSLIATASIILQWIEARQFGYPYVEAIVVAILLGMTIRTCWIPGPRWQAGIAFSAKQLLEIAVMLLGASLSVAAITAAGPWLFGSVVAIVVLTLGFSYGIGRLFRLPAKMSLLIACGNAICGNSAIAAAAPVIGASSDDVGASISFTAILGVITVLSLPLLIPVFGLTELQYGVLAGLTVYAVPQVLAATIPVGIISTQVGTLVKLIRVLMLGPVLLALAVCSSRMNTVGGGRATRLGRGVSLVPWFIPGFILLASLRSLDVIPAFAIAHLATTAGILTICSMAALGLGVDLSLIGRVGSRIAMAVSLSLMTLVAAALICARFF